MSETSSLDRFISAQENTWQSALTEIKNGRKQGHWMWFIFPQILGLGQSQTSSFYAIKDLAEAEKYFRHPVLGKRLVEICKALIMQNVKDATQIFGSPDDVKLRSSMTLFNAVPNSGKVFKEVLNVFFNGTKDQQTLHILKQ